MQTLLVAQSKKPSRAEGNAVPFLYLHVAAWHCGLTAAAEQCGPGAAGIVPHGLRAASLSVFALQYRTRGGHNSTTFIAEVKIGFGCKHSVVGESCPFV